MIDYNQFVKIRRNLIGCIDYPISLIRNMLACTLGGLYHRSIRLAQLMILNPAFLKQFDIVFSLIDNQALFIF